MFKCLLMCMKTYFIWSWVIDKYVNKHFWLQSVINYLLHGRVLIIWSTGAESVPDAWFNWLSLSLYLSPCLSPSLSPCLSVCLPVPPCLSLCLSPCLPVCVQVLIELDSALLDDQPHWYKLQLHDVSSVPLPVSSPYLQRRGLQPEDSPSSRRLQSESCCFFLLVFSSLPFFVYHLSHLLRLLLILFYFSPIMLCQRKVFTTAQVITAVWV